VTFLLVRNQWLNVNLFTLNFAGIVVRIADGDALDMA
jgi:hypothetical protein